MIKKLFHIADLHFRTYKRHDECRDVCQKFIDEVKGYITDNGLNYDEARIVIAGDIVHQKITISNELSVLVSWFLEECSKLCSVIMQCLFFMILCLDLAVDDGVQSGAYLIDCLGIFLVVYVNCCVCLLFQYALIGLWVV